MDFKMRLQNELRLLYCKTKKRYDDYFSFLNLSGKFNFNDFSEEEKKNIIIMDSWLAAIIHIENLVAKMK